MKEYLMLHKQLRVWAMIAFLLVLAACQSPLSTNNSNDPNTDPPTQIVETGLRLTIPRFSPWLLDAISQALPVEQSSRALAVADSFRVIIRDGNDSVLHNQLYAPISANVLSATQSVEISLAAGSGYSVVLEVFNNDNSGNGGLVVRGSAENITILDSQTTAISIACTPVSPVSYTIGAVGTSFSIMATQ